MRRRLTLCALMAMMFLLAGAAATQNHAMAMTNDGNATVAMQQNPDGFGGMQQLATNTGTTYNDQQVAIYANDGVATTNLAINVYDQNGFLQLASGPPTFCLASLNGATPWTTLLTASASGPPNTFDAAALASANLANTHDPMTTFTLASSTSPPLMTSEMTAFYATRDELGAVSWTPMAKNMREVAHVTKWPLNAVAFNRTPANFAVMRT